jgi:hypothetical protein
MPLTNLPFWWTILQPTRLRTEVADQVRLHDARDARGYPLHGKHPYTWCTRS